MEGIGQVVREVGTGILESRVDGLAVDEDKGALRGVEHDVGGGL